MKDTGPTHNQRRARHPEVTSPLRRSSHKIIAGIAGGIAEFTGANPAVVRWVFGISVVMTWGITLALYLLLWLLLPKPPNVPEH